MCHHGHLHILETLNKKFMICICVSFGPLHAPLSSRAPSDGRWGGSLAHSLEFMLEVGSRGVFKDRLLPSDSSSLRITKITNMRVLTFPVLVFSESVGAWQLCEDGMGHLD